MRKPYEYQKGIIERSIERPFTMVNAACGTGKSLIASQTALGKGKPTLIITPKNIMDDFKDELIADGVPEEDIFVYDAAKSHKDGYYEDFSHWLCAMEYIARKELEEKAEETDDDEEVIF
jgi:superfamily II DNA or RNA helicase